MKLKSTFLLVLSSLFILSANVNLEARHSRHYNRVEVINQTYVTHGYYPQYVVQPYYPQPVYVSAPAPVYVEQPVVYVGAPVCRERVVVRERTSPAAIFTSFALGLGIGLIR